jgi:tripartite-type tricarboxylate transporter receptor subunit TctC
MTLPRRRFLQLAASALVFPAVSPAAWAQSYPARPVRIVVGLAPGSSPDIIARLMGQWLSERLGQTFVIENRPGAGATIAADAVVRAAPDGHTLLLVSGTNAISATLHKSNFDLIRDIAPVGSIVTTPAVMVVHPSVPARTVAEFVAYAKANRGKINMASAGNGTPPHVAGELFKMMAGVDMVHVPYRGGGPALTDLLGGQMHVMFPSTSASIEYIRTGRLRALGVTTSARLEVLPGVPTVSDTVPGYEASTWFGVAAPRNTPAGIIGKLNREINAALADPKIKARLADLGNTVLPGSPADFGKLIADEIEKWARVIRFAGITANG